MSRITDADLLSLRRSLPMEAGDVEYARAVLARYADATELLDCGGGGMSAHTPGPWLIADTGCGFEVEATNGTQVAQAFKTKPVRNSSDHDERRANARLIASAPELLEALILMVRTHDEPAETLLQEVKEMRWLAKARAAITKATKATGDAA